MITLTPEADAHLARLTVYYEDVGRIEAAENLLEGLELERLRILTAPDRGFPSPRPYPQLKRFGFPWIYEQYYWISYTRSNPPQITSIFHDTANIPGWL